MKLTQLVTKTLRTEPAEAETASHRLLLKAGMMMPVAAGLYTYLPLGLRALAKTENIVREEMDAAGCQEIRMPALQPLEIWEQSGRAAAMGETLFRMKDRRERPMVLAPTHEEVVTSTAAAFVESYRDLPLILYQIQTKFRDEPRPRAGLIRVREFDMMDAYSFDTDDEAVLVSYEKMAEAYRRIYKRCGVPAVQVEADSGAIGGKYSHEFLLPTEVGEDTIILCPKCGYAANAEKAQSVKPQAPAEAPLPMEDVHTPGIKTIADLAAFLKIPAHKTLKAVFYNCDGKVVFAVIRGDLDVNEVKLKNAVGCRDLRLATGPEVEAAGLVAGSASPIGLKGIRRIADESIKMGSNFVAGANRHDHHVRNVNFPRDFEADLVTDIALAQAGQGCPRCGAPLEAKRGIEIGHIFKLGTVFSEKFSATFLDKEGQKRPAIMGCYGIGIGRLLAAVIEQNHDDKGIIFPASVAPYHVQLVGLSMDDKSVVEAADALYKDLWAAGVETLYDDRLDSPGVKFNDADLIGLPLRVVVSPRTLKQRSAELKRRSEKPSINAPLADVVGKVKEMLRGT